VGSQQRRGEELYMSAPLVLLQCRRLVVVVPMSRLPIHIAPRIAPATLRNPNAITDAV
jgi:hypothetical protein